VNELLLAVGQAFWLFAPLLVAAAVSGVVVKLHLLAFLARPIDGGLTLGGKPVFGQTKTWRGIVAAALGAALGAYLQRFIDVGALALVDYHRPEAVAMGAALGTGAMLGELPNSFVKRRVGVPSSGTTKGRLRVLFYIWDQVDLLTGTWPLVALWVRPTWPVVLATFVLTMAVHPLVALVGWLIGARKTAR
jgi:hypothetical protein